MKRASLATRLFAVVFTLTSLLAAACTAVFYHQGTVQRQHSALVTSHPIRPSVVVGVVTNHLAEFEHATQTRVNLAVRYIAWNHPMPQGRILAMQRAGIIPLIEMMPRNVSMAGLAGGADDRYLRMVAREVVSIGGKLAMSFAPEMDGTWYSWGWGSTSPLTWVAAWRHVVTLFRAQGASNVTWVWMASPAPDRLAQYWPGKSYVDLIGIDGYYYRRTETFGTIFGPSILAVRQFASTPILLSETGIGQVAGQAKMMGDLFAGIHRYRLLGLVWFDICQHAGFFHQCWRLEGHPRAIAAFRKGVKAMMAGH